jgi:hypothetical protein
MATMKLDPAIVAHLEWIGFVRPTGLVVSAPALVRAGAVLNRADAEGQRLLREVLQERTFSAAEGPTLLAPDFRSFASQVLGWSFSPKGYAGTADIQIPLELELTLTEYSETLRPDFAVRELEPKEGAAPWQLLVKVLDAGEDFDRIVRGSGTLEASAHSRMERLLRHTGVSAGLLFNGRAVRLVSAPRGESSGWLDFHINEMVQTAGRPISAAMRLLLRETRLLTGPRVQRLSALLEDSRKFQNEVSERLAEQVLHALYEMMRGFQAAHDASKGELLREPLVNRPDDIYHALLTVMLRLVFLLFAEERDMLPEEETFLRNYSLGGLHERLREDAVLYPDTMDQRYGAWAQLLVLFRMVFNGADADGMHLPRRHGVLFDPDRFPFLEGRTAGDPLTNLQRAGLPLVPDGTIYRALEKLLVLDGERISYRALDVEQIGSVYETMMGFRLEVATGRSVAIKSQKKQGAPTALDLDALLALAGANRAKSIQDGAERKLTDKVRKSVVEAGTLEDLHAALLQVIDQAATPDLVPRGAMILQPSEARRRSGSHYTPRALTEPIVRTTLDPVLARMRGSLGRSPRPESILDLKVCDPAMGSGAFLVETCRYLGDALVEAWRVHGGRPEIPTDEDELVLARRLVAQRCLYGVDRNPMAVDLAKVSLWLVTLAKDHALTFVDHALRHGDSLVGLTRAQIENFHWDTSVTYDSPFRSRLREQVAHVSSLRKKIREADESVSDEVRRELWNEAQVELDVLRIYGDLAISAFFDADKPKDREHRRLDYVSAIVRGEVEHLRGGLEVRRTADPPLVPFHWEIEFPEVFQRDDPGFDAFAGNPPFLGGSQLSESSGGPEYQEWLKITTPGSFGNADLCSYFFRLAFALVRNHGAIGFLATKSIAEGSTRTTGLQYILTNGAQIYQAVRSQRWPGDASVLVSIVHIAKSGVLAIQKPMLDRKQVVAINSRLHPSTEVPDPVQLTENDGLGFFGTKLGGIGFVLEAEEYEQLCREANNRKCLLPILGGEEVNESSTQEHRRYVITFGSESLEYAESFPELIEIVRRRVKPERDRALDHGPGKHGKKYWWQFTLRADPLYRAVNDLSRCLVTAITTSHLGFSFQPIRQVFSHSLVVCAFDRYAQFACVQSRIHLVWAQLLSSSLGSTMRYSVSDAFQTFPFPENYSHDQALEAAGMCCYEFRANLMIRNNEGLTKTYNRFHNPDERDPDILKLRDLHAAMDRIVLNAYGWHDISTDCEFLLDNAIDEEEWGDKKKPYRYRWPDLVRDEVLARLLELNAKRARAEALAGAEISPKGAGKRAAKPEVASPDLKDLFS